MNPTIFPKSHGQARLLNWRSLCTQGKSLVVTNGCFDLLHAGHVHYLAQAKEQGDCLLIGLNGSKCSELKGPTRPINPEGDRALVLAALASVDAVCVFAEKRATRFLEKVQPTFMSKGAITRSRLWMPTNARRFSHGEASSSSFFGRALDHPNHPPHGLERMRRALILVATSCPLVPGRRGIPTLAAVARPHGQRHGTSCQPSSTWSETEHVMESLPSR